MTKKLYYGDNLQVLRESVADESVDLIYLDPPFNSNASYNVLFKAPSGAQSQAQIEAFDDTWHWNDSAERAFDEVLTGGHSDAAIMLKAMRSALGENDMMAYLAMMAVRLIELHRVLKPTGSLYLRCDPTASHYLKMILDSVFDPQNFRNEVVWKRSTAHSDTKQGRRLYGRIHDTALYYTKNSEWTWNTIYTSYENSYVKSHYSRIEADTGRRYRVDNLTAARPGGDTLYEWKGVRPHAGRYWAYSKQKMQEFETAGRLVYTRTGMPEYKRYLNEMPGVPLQDMWADIDPINSRAQERLQYPTQKPAALLERILSAS
jgi:DNA modification methylase